MRVYIYIYRLTFQLKCTQTCFSAAPCGFEVRNFPDSFPQQLHQKLEEMSDENQVFCLFNTFLWHFLFNGEHV